MTTSRGLYSAFNARNLTPAQVAESFIPNEAFERLLENNHSVLMGPRGSGKTTLLKMLTYEALRNWKVSKAKEVLKDAPFVAVYVPTDIQWSRQLESSAEELRKSTRALKSEEVVLFSQAAVTTNIFDCLCQSMSSYLQYRKITSNTLEAKLSEQLYKTFGLKQDGLSLLFVRATLKQRVSLIREQELKMRLSGRKSALPDFFYYDYLAKADSACELFESICCQGKFATKWALCFDELEIAPPWLSKRLFTDLRSTSQRFLFKLGTSPIPEVETQATPRDDFSLIQLWADSKDKKSSLFTKKIAASVMKQKQIEILDPYELFGRSRFSTDEGASEYKEGSYIWRIFRDEAEVDLGLRRVLTENEISPQNPVGNQQQLDTVLRKIKPIVLCRNANRHYKNGKPFRRTRKVVKELYSGFDVIAAMSEGNPRWLIGIMQDMLDQSPVKGVPISPDVQARILLKVTSSYWAKLKVVPDTKIDVGGKSIFLTRFVEQIADFFFDKIVMGDFSVDPIGSFEVDGESDKQCAILIRKAAEQGAIIPVDREVFTTGLLNRRFRVSYMLAPRFKLPLRLYSSIKLSACFSSSLKTSQSSHVGQLELFNQ